MSNEGVLNKIRSGVDIIDGRLGGLIASKAYLVYGEPGTGKTLFGLQFLNEGLIQGETCGLVTQENPDDLLSMGRHIGFSLDDHLTSGQLVVLRYLPNFAPHFSKSFDLDEVFDELRSLSDAVEMDRLVFDPITPFVDCVNRMNYTKVFAEFFTFLEKLGSTTVLTLDEIAGIHTSPFLRTLISLAFGAIHLRVSPDLERKMFFQKLKYESVLLGPASYTIEPHRGIVPLPSQQEEPEGSESPKRKVLVADGDLKACEEIKRTLGDRYALTFVHDGIEALTKIVNNPLDLIILDATLPKIDGFDVCRRLRSQRSSVPIFLISGERRRTSDKISGFNLGADEYMLKPLNLLELESRMRAVLQRGRDVKHTALPRAEGPSEEVSPATPKRRKRVPLSQAAFERRVEREIERAPCNSFTLVSCQFDVMNGRERQELIPGCTRALFSEVRKDDFVGNLGNGTFCVFLRGAGRESSAGFVRRARKRISKLTRQKPGSSVKMKTGLATFPADGEDTGTLLKKVLGSCPGRS